MEEHEAEQEAEYPRGRGYGHDYMRGGEVFGGYGYSDRHEYVRPRGATNDETTDADGGGAGDGDGDGDDPLPRDARAGGWAIPHDLQGTSAADAAPPVESGDGEAPLDGQDVGAGAPVPVIDRTLGGASIGGMGRSRSYYVTQAQLQQRLYRTQRDERGGGQT